MADRDHVAGCTRRRFLLGAGCGLAAGAPLGWLGLRAWQHWHRPASSGPATETSATLGMPGPFPGRVVEVRHPAVVSAAHEIDDSAVVAMMDRGMCALTGADEAHSAWRRLFEPSDIV